MKFALCNEVLAPLPFAAQCRIAAALGYMGLEVAPYTVADDPEAMTEADARALAAVAADHGIAITGLHWLLVRPAGLSITAPDGAVRARTVAMMRRLCELCAAMGGTYLVHGSNAQRAVAPGETVATAVDRATEAFAAAGAAARAAGVTYCIEPLSPAQTRVINTLADAAAIVRAVDNPHLRTMIDTSSAGVSEAEPVADLIRRWMPTGLVAHVQVNDPNRRAPGQGAMEFGPILRALADTGYAGVVAAEPFEYVPDGPGCAARAIGYLQGLAESL
ncbi:MAG: sugar phosphate isomerase/epimerase [Burkholderiales bacterium]|nr:sugar phosphate isomerase/epimerase [Burkholderiales bacterium]